MKQFIEINETLISTDTITTIERISNVSLGLSFKCGGYKEFDFSTQAFSTKYSEINVACESCHGPGAEHDAQAKSGAG